MSGTTEQWREDAIMIMVSAMWMFKGYKRVTVGQWAMKYVDGIVAVYGGIEFALDLGYRIEIDEKGVRGEN